jgi:O-antigen/teichoic acid export membrane protein
MNINKFNMDKRNSIFKNILLLLTSNIITQVIYFLVFIYIARKFGPVSFGQLNWSKAIAQYFILFSIFGLDNIAMIDTIKDKNSIEKIKSTFNKIFTQRLVLSLISYLLLLVFILVIPKEIEVKVLTLIVGLSILSKVLNIDWFFKSFQQMEHPATSEIIRTTLYCLLLIIALSISDSLYLVPLALFIAETISYLYMMWKYPLKIRLSNTLIDIGTLRRSYPFFVSGIFATINLNIDTVVIGFTREAVEVGLYSSAYKIVSVFILIITFVFTAIKPVMIEDFNRKRFQELENLVRMAKRVVILLAVPIAVSGFVISEEIIVTLFGEEYKNAQIVLSILLLYTSILFMREIYGYQLVAYNLHKKYMKIVTLSSLVNILLNIILIPNFGIVVAALTSLISEIINITLMRRACKPIIKAKLKFIYYVKVFGSSAILYGILTILKNYWSNAILLSIIGGTIYIILILLFKTISIGNVKLLLKGIKK